MNRVLQICHNNYYNHLSSQLMVLLEILDMITCKDDDSSNVNYIDVLALESTYYVCKIGYCRG